MPGTDRVEIRTLKVGRFCVVDDEATKFLVFQNQSQVSTVLQKLGWNSFPSFQQRRFRMLVL